MNISVHYLIAKTNGEIVEFCQEVGDAAGISALPDANPDVRPKRVNEHASAPPHQGYDRSSASPALVPTSAQLPIPYAIARERLPVAEPEIIRPTVHSSKSEIARYLQRASDICRSARSDLIAGGIIAESDFVKLTPVEGCFVGDPPKPRVTISEVIAVIIDRKLVENLSDSNKLDHFISHTAKLIQYKAKEYRQNFNSRVYTLFYSAAISTEEDGHSFINEFIAADFDQETNTNAPLQEYMERRDLLNSLRKYYGDKGVKDATAAGGGSPSVDGSLQQFVTDIIPTWRRYAENRPKELDLALHFSGLSLLAIIVAIAIIWLFGWKSTAGTAASLLGFIAMLALRAASDWASEVAEGTAASKSSKA